MSPELLFAAALRPADFLGADFVLLFAVLPFDALLLAALPFDALFLLAAFDPDFAVLLAAISRLPFGPAREEMRPRRTTSLTSCCSAGHCLDARKYSLAQVKRRGAGSFPAKNWSGVSRALWRGRRQGRIAAKNS
jgi:hypothetical protein